MDHANLDPAAGREQPVSAAGGHSRAARIVPAQNSRSAGLAAGSCGTGEVSTSDILTVADRLLNGRCPYCGGLIEWSTANGFSAPWYLASYGRCRTEGVVNRVNPDFVIRELLSRVAL